MASLSASVGRWGPPTSPIDWCEANYETTSWVAEPFNTFSNAAYLVVALLALRRQGGRPESRDGSPSQQSHHPLLRLSVVMIALTGIFSAMFHATLWHIFQRLDECAENAIIVFLLYALKGKPVSWATWHCMSAVFLIFALGDSPLQFPFAEVHLVGMVVVTCMALAAKKVPRGEHVALSTVVRNTALAGACWAVDFFLCAWVRRLPVNPQLHLWWHVFTARALHLGLIAAEQRCV